MTERLTWTAGDYGVEHGRAGKVALFSIAYRTARTAPEWQLRSLLPGYNARQHVWQDDSKEALKSKAERLLERWLREVRGE